MQRADLIAVGAREGRRLRLGWPERFDVLTTAGIAVLYVVTLGLGDSRSSATWFALPVIAISLVPLFWRSQAPVLVLVLVIVLQWAIVTPVDGFEVDDGMAAALTVAVALGGVAARSRLWVSALALAASFVQVVLLFMVAYGVSAPGWLVLNAAILCGIAWGLGTHAGRSRRRVRALQADHVRAAEAVTAERVRIATELNGIITVAVGRMLDEASRARDSIRIDRPRTVTAFAAIEAAGVEAMNELRRLLHLLHDDPELSSPDPSPEAEPASTRARLVRRLSAVDDSDAFTTMAVIAATMWVAAQTFPPPAGMLACLYFGVVLCVMVWRRVFPVAVFLLVIVGNAGAVLLFYGGDFTAYNQTAFPGVLVALAAVAGLRSAWVSIPLLVVGWAYIALPVVGNPPWFSDGALISVFAVVAVWITAFIAGQRRRHVDRLQAARDAARRSVRTERARLAYELHDVVGHSITIMVLQAAGARRIIDQDPARAAAALIPIEESGAEARRELERLLTVLRGDATSGPASPPETGDLTDVTTLVERSRRTAPNAELIVVGTPGRLEPSVGAAAYCVVREGLTNAVKHAGPDAQVLVSISWLPDVARVEVVSGPTRRDPSRSTELSGGFGLLSVRERVILAGGEIRWFTDGSDFHVEARLPVATPNTESESPIPAH